MGELLIVMERKYIDIDNQKWGIILIYGFDDNDYDEMSEIMASFGMNERNINKSLHILSTYNSGMAISNSAIRMSAVFIGKASSRAQFWSTINHELLHIEQAILDYYGVDWDGEPPAYLAGYLLQRVVEEIAVPCY